MVIGSPGNFGPDVSSISLMLQRGSWPILDALRACAIEGNQFLCFSAVEIETGLISCRLR